MNYLKKLVWACASLVLSQACIISAASPGGGLWSADTSVYEASATILVTGRFFENNFLDRAESIEPSPKDFAYFVAAAGSDRVIRNVRRHISDNFETNMREVLAKPHLFKGRMQIEEVLQQSLMVIPQADGVGIQVLFRYPDPVIAADIANLFAKETINYQLTVVVDRQIVRVESLRIRVDLHAERIKQLLKKDQSDVLVSIDLDTEKQLYSKLLSELKIAKAQVSLAESSAIVLDRAYPPLDPIL